MSSHLEEALRLAELNFPVFPLIKGRKDPATPHGCKDATTDESAILAWWESNPEANIGLATDGLLVVDVDGAENPWLAGQTERQLDLARAPISQTAGGGRHYLFRYAAGRNSAGKLAEKVDTRGAGGYIVAPPSKVSGREYKWIGPLDVPRDRLPEPPGWLIDQLDGRESTPSTRTSAPVESNIIPDGQRNDTLARLAGTMRRVGMGLAEIRAALQAANAERCRPPMDAAEVDRIAESVARYEPDQISTAVVEDHYAQMAALSDPPAESSIADPGPIDKQLLFVPGFINEVVDYTISTAPYPSKVLAFAGALSLQSFLASRKVCDESGLRSSLYILNLAHSSAGKDHPRKTVRKILREVGLESHIGNSVASKEGLEDILAHYLSYLLLMDEVDAMLNSIKMGRDDRHRNIAAAFLEFYTTADSDYTTRVRAGRESFSIRNPGLSILGTAIPARFYEALSPRMLTDGFFARLLIFKGEKRGQGQVSTIRDLPEPIREAAKFWATLAPGDGNLANQHPTPIVVKADADAKAAFATYRAYADSQYSAAEDRGDEAAMAIWGRAFEKAGRLALNYACSADYRNLLITGPAVEWASGMVNHLTAEMLFDSHTNVSENEFDNKQNKLIAVLRKWKQQHGDEGMPHWQLARRLRGWTPREHEDVRRSLIDKGLISRENVTTSGRPAELYRAR